MQTIAESELELSNSIAIEQQIAGELSTLTARLSEAESTAGDRALQARKSGDDKEVQKINDELSDLNAQHRVLSKTLEAAREAIKAARHEINMCRGRDLRVKAEAINKEVAQRQERTAGLLKELMEFEGIWYIPEPQSRAGVYLTGTIAESKTAKLATEASFLIHQAEITENQIVRVEPRASTNGRKSSAVSPDATGHYPTT